MKYNKKFILKNDFSQLMFDFDYFIKKEFSIEFYKNGTVISFLTFDKDVRFDFSIICRTQRSTSIAFSIKTNE